MDEDVMVFELSAQVAHKAKVPDEFRNAVVDAAHDALKEAIAAVRGYHSIPAEAKPLPPQSWGPEYR